MDDFALLEVIITIFVFLDQTMRIVVTMETSVYLFLHVCVNSIFVFFQASRKDFEGFKNLFHRFLQVKGPSVEWVKIQRPPEDSVSVVNISL